MRGPWTRWAAYLCEPVDAASLGVLRIVLGAMIAWDVTRYFHYGWIAEYYIRPTVHFTYPFFGFVHPWPGEWMYVHFAAMGLIAAAVAVGFCYRGAAVLLFLAYTYVFLLEQSVYMNHYYLIVLLCFLLAWMPAERAFSIDRRWRPGLPTTVPRWNVLLLRFQLFVVYFYGAIAKLNADWLAGEPMHSGLIRRGYTESLPVPAALIAYAIAYGGIVFDAAVPILLCFRRTRRIGFGLALGFHALNELFLRIGLFSYLMTGAITIFFAPDWPRRLRPRWWPRPATVPALPRAAAPGAWRLVTLVAVHLYVLAQLLIPLRHWLYPGNVSWTEEGHRFSWHMKLRNKESTLYITATDPVTGRAQRIDPEQDLELRQVRKLETFPDILLQYVHYERDRLRREGWHDPVIQVEWMCSLNGAPPRLLVDPQVNLAAVKRSFWPATWILRQQPNAEARMAKRVTRDRGSLSAVERHRAAKPVDAARPPTLQPPP